MNADNAARARFDLAEHLATVQQRCQHMLNSNAARYGQYGADYEHMRYAFPYCVQPYGTARLIVLNRDYKPVGLQVPYSVWVEYEGFTAWQLHDNPAASTWAAACYVKAEGNAGAFFDSGCAPWGRRTALRDYSARLWRWQQYVLPALLIEAEAEAEAAAA